MRKCLKQKYFCRKARCGSWSGNPEIALKAGIQLFVKIAIIGLGYVGLPLSLQFARSGVTVLGLDIDPAKVKSLNAGTQLHPAHPLRRRARTGGGGTVLRLGGLCPRPRSRGRHHLRADSAEKKPRAGHFLHPEHRQGHRAVLKAENRKQKTKIQDHKFSFQLSDFCFSQAGCSGIHHLSRHHGGGIAGCSGRRFRLQGRERIFIWRIRRNAKTPATRTAGWRTSPSWLAVTRRRASNAPSRFIAGPSKSSSRCPPAARRRPQNCWRTFSAASTSRS